MRGLPCRDEPACERLSVMHGVRGGNFQRKLWLDGLRSMLWFACVWGDDLRCRLPRWYV